MPQSDPTPLWGAYPLGLRKRASAKVGGDSRAHAWACVGARVGVQARACARAQVCVCAFRADGKHAGVRVHDPGQLMINNPGVLITFL